MTDHKDSEKDPPKSCTRGPCFRCLWRTILFRSTVLLVLSLVLARTLAFLWRNLQDDPLSTEPFSRYGLRQGMPKAESEAVMLSVPSAQSANETARKFSSHPHLAGSDQDFKDAMSMLRMLQDEFLIKQPPVDPVFPAGSSQSQKATLELTSTTRPSAWIDVYYPYLDRPLERSLEILDEQGSSVWNADLVEDGDPRDEDAHKYKDAIHAWHGFSWHGEAQGQLIYANYGRQEDYQDLLSTGANLTDKIVIVRYGGIYRGLKIKGAEELGAAGVLIYSDPRDDGYVTVENGFRPYPFGPARNPSSVQRGSSMFLSVYPGDPTTPGYPSYENAERQQATNIPRIPSLPISWQNAQRLLEEIDGLYVNGTNGRVLSGRVSSKTVKIVNHVEGKVKPIWNAMASIPGHIRDEVVFVGAHRDAWVLGGADPISGTVSLYEAIRGFGALLRKGWRPLRTIVFASWDAEEQGLIGSVEYGEDFASWISEHVVAYVNVDTSSSGSQWNVAASPSLAHLIKQTALDVPHPSGDGRTLWDARYDEGAFTPNHTMAMDPEVLVSYGADKEAKQSSSTGIGALGSGSDYTVFLQRLGVASIDQGFGRTPTDAVYHYHSIYDSLRWQEQYADPDFGHHLAVAKHLGLLTLRLADAITLPLNTTHYALELEEYLNGVERIVASPGTGLAADLKSLREVIVTLQDDASLLEDEKESAERRLRELLDKMPKIPPRLGVCQRRSALYNKVANFVKGVFGVRPHHEYDTDFWRTDLVSVNLENYTNEASDRKSPFPVKEFIKAAKRVRAVNKKLASFERGLISKEGIKDREWYKHLGVAPGKWLGYGATTFPGLTEAIVIDKNNTLASHEARRLIHLISRLADNIHPSQNRIRYCRW